MNGAIPALLLYAFVAWTETTLKLTLTEFLVINVLLKSVEQWILFTFIPH